MPGPTCSASTSAMAATTTMPRASPCCARSSRSAAGRSARSWTCRARSCGSAVRRRPGHRSRAGDQFRLDLDTGARRPAARQPAASRDLRGAAAGPGPAARRRQASGCGSSSCGPDFADTIVVNGGGLSDRKGVNVPERDAADLGLDREGPRRPQLRPRARRRLGGAVVRAAARRHRRSARADRRPRRDPGQDREARRDRAAGRDHRAVRRGDGGARRPRRRAAAGAGAGRCRSGSSARAASWASRWWWRPRCWRA